MRSIYYDTNVFWEFFLMAEGEKSLPDSLKEFFPKDSTTAARRITAPWTLDEFCYKFSIKKFKEALDDSDFRKKTEVLTKIPAFLAYFTQEVIDSREINIVFFTLFQICRENGLVTKKKGDKLIHTKDLLHLAYALCSRCTTFLSTDGAFKELCKVEQIKKLMSSKELQEIIIVDFEDMSSIERIKLF